MIQHELECNVLQAYDSGADSDDSNFQVHQRGNTRYKASRR